MVWQKNLRLVMIFYEGIRAAVIDKDRQPRWQPDDLANVSESDVDNYFVDTINGLKFRFFHLQSQRTLIVVWRKQPFYLSYQRTLVSRKSIKPFHFNFGILIAF